jgi:(p)ppGpp synthase/HD superfamily hydrolase
MDTKLLLYAVNFAAEAHRNQRRRYQNLPYINHLLRVGEQAALAELSQEAIEAAFLHDVLEDTNTKEEALRNNFSARVVDLIKLLTKWWPDEANGPEVASSKSKYYSLISKDSEATSLKLLDRADNILDYVVSLPEAENEAKRYLSETHIEFPLLVSCCDNEFVKTRFSYALKTLEEGLN